MVSMLTCIVLAFCVVNTNGVDHQYCDDLNPQSDINIAQITGVWSGVEYISHEKYPQNYFNNYEYHNGLDNVGDCIFVDIKELDFQPSTPSYQPASTAGHGPRDPGLVVPEQQYRHLVLQWDEPGYQLDYYVKFNMSRRGIWISSAPQNGVPVADMYKHFSGTIQVLKAVNDHLVLSFCQRLPESKLFSVVLSRQPSVDDVDIISIHSMLSRKGLSTSSVKKICNGAAGLDLSLFSFFVACVFGIVMS